MKIMRSNPRQKATAPETAEANPLTQRFDRRVRLSWLALFGERVWEALLWPFLVVLTFLVVSLLELWSLLPPLAHRILLGGFGLALLFSSLPPPKFPWRRDRRPCAVSNATRGSSTGRPPPMKTASARRCRRKPRRCGRLTANGRAVC